jgi:hypothetical protein
MKVDMNKFKKGVDVYGWIVCVGIVILLWVVCLWDSLHDYYGPNAKELTKLVVALLGTIVIWLFQLLSGGREWLESQKAAMEWMAEHDLAMIEQMDKLHVSKLQDVTNIIGDGTGAPGIGGKPMGTD